MRNAYIKSNEVKPASAKSHLMLCISLLLLVISCQMENNSEGPFKNRKQEIESTPGLAAFWDFHSQLNGTFVSSGTANKYPIFLRQIGDSLDYTIDQWPYQEDNAKILYDSSGPLGHAIRFNRGFIYGAVARRLFNQTPIDVQGYQPFTMMSWVKFIGQRHFISGIWDEGGWHKYAGRRQFALFAGLFHQKGVIAHLSKTGAASYPQSDTSGAQYARIRAIDAIAFENHEWICAAMTYHPGRKQIRAYLNGKSTEHILFDPVEYQVYREMARTKANPLSFDGPIFGQQHIVIKFDGYLGNPWAIAEHRLVINLAADQMVYQRDHLKSVQAPSFRVRVRFKKSSPLKSQTIILSQVDKLTAIPAEIHLQGRDTITAKLEQSIGHRWQQIGTEIIKGVTDGAPFTFGRALGLASEEIEHGSQLFIDGVALFDRVLTDEEISRLAFTVHYNK